MGQKLIEGSNPSLSASFPRRPTDRAPCQKKPDFPERWPSGRRRTLGKRVYPRGYRGFESHSLRHLVCGCGDCAARTRSRPRSPAPSAGFRAAGRTKPNQRPWGLGTAGAKFDDRLCARFRRSGFASSASTSGDAALLLTSQAGPSRTLVPKAGPMIATCQRSQQPRAPRWRPVVLR